MSVSLAPYSFIQSLTAGGLPLNAGLLNTYIAGGTTPQATFTTSAGNVQNANPIVLGTDGLPPNEIWLTNGVSYRFDLTDSLGNLRKSWDNVSNAGDLPSTALITVAGSNTITATANTPPSAYVVGQAYDFVVSATNTGAVTLNIAGLGAGAVQIAGAALSGGELLIGSAVRVLTTALTPVFQIIANGQVAPFLDTNPLVKGSSDGTKLLKFEVDGFTTATTRTITPPDQDLTLQADNFVCNGRLTLTTAVPITTTDVTAATTVFFTPYLGNEIATFNGTFWNKSVFTEKTVAVPATTSTPFDVFIVDSTLALETVNWTNDTTRATAIVLQNGVFVKSGTPTRRYLGTLRTTTVSGQTEDSVLKRYCWNYYNRVQRSMSVIDTTNSWTYTTQTWHQANASAANQVAGVIGVAENVTTAQVLGILSNSSAGVFVAVGVGVNVTNANSAQVFGGIVSQVVNLNIQTWARYSGVLPIGGFVLAWLEISQAIGTTTWLGDNGSVLVQTGLTAEGWA